VDYVCYPECSLEEMRNRVDQLKSLNVEAVSFGGPHVIMGYPVLGKGHVGVVLNALYNGKIVALKARRTDADRFTMTHEAAMLETANGVNVGPKIIEFTKDFIIMEKLEGPYFGEWARSFTGKKGRFLKVVREILWKVYKLDEVGLDHGELNQIRRHIIIHENKPRLVDFESASTDRRVQNVTSTIQSIFLNYSFSQVMNKWIKLPDKEEIIKYLREYKENISEENFIKILRLLDLS
jgi:putative serine/threonine protein kinase